MNAAQIFGLALRLAPLFLRQKQPLKPETVLNEKDVALIELRQKDGAVIVVLGTRGTGKTELAYRLAEFLGKPVFAISPEQVPHPDFITLIKPEEINERVPPNSTLILDDVPTFMSNRDYHDSLVREIEKIIPMVRHQRKLHMIFCSQSGSIADRYILDADCAFLKPGSIFLEDLERPGIKKWYQEANQFFQNKDMEWVRRHAFMVTPTFKGIIEIKKVN